MSDGPNTGDTLITTLAVSHGTITVGTTSGVTIGGNGTGTVTLTGTAAAIDAALTTSANANYTGNLNYYGPDSLSVQTTDTNNSATSGTKTVGITLADTTTVSEAVPASLSGNENTAISLSGNLSVSDGPNTGDTLITTLAVSHGTITVGATSGVTIGGNGTGTVTLTGTAAAIDAALTTSTNANYTGNLNYYGPDSLSVQTTDTNNSATSGTKTVGITLADTTTVSEAVPASLSGNENTAISLSGNFRCRMRPNTGDTLITTLAVSHGTITVGATSGVTIGGNGTGTVTLTGTAAAIDAALTTSTNANYTGNLNYYGPDSLSVQTTDTNNSATSGTKTVGITLADTTTVSEAVPASLSGNENTAISLSGISVSDGPNTGDTLITTLAVSHGTITVGATSGVTIGGNGTGTVTLTGTAAAIDAALTTSANANYTGNLNYYGPDSLSVQTTDTNNSATSGTKTVGITLADTTTVSEAVPASLSGNENTAISLSGNLIGVGWS